VRAGLARSARDYKWSSYRANAMDLPDGLVQASSEWLALGKTDGARAKSYQQLFASGTEDHDEQIRVALRKGRPLV